MNQNENQNQDMQPMEGGVSEPMEHPQSEEEIAPVEATPVEESATVEETTPVEEPATVEEIATVEESAPVEATPAQPQIPAHTYHWTYAEQKLHDKQTSKGNKTTGVWVYALVMTAVFALSFGLLLGVMFMKGEELPQIQLSEGVTSQEDVQNQAAIAPVQEAKQSVVVIEVTTKEGVGSGTGIILSKNGYIATNHHVIDGGGKIRVRFYDGTYAEATLRGSSEVDDLAVIKVERNNLVPATFAKSSECYVGQTVYAIGNPGGPEFAWTTTKGIISYVDREVKMYDDEGILEKKLKLLQTDAMVNPGNSGGPLVNTQGEVVGVVSMKLADGYEGIGFAIPSDGAIEILQAIIRDGHADSVNSNISYDRPMLGIVGVYVEGGKHYIMTDDRIQEVTKGQADKYPDIAISPAVSGIYVSELTQGLDVYDKLMVGDIITAIDGVEAVSMNALMSVLNDHYVGDVVAVTYYRNGQSYDVTVTLGTVK